MTCHTVTKATTFLVLLRALFIIQVYIHMSFYYENCFDPSDTWKDSGAPQGPTGHMPRTSGLERHIQASSSSQSPSQSIQPSSSTVYPTVFSHYSLGGLLFTLQQKKLSCHSDLYYNTRPVTGCVIWSKVANPYQLQVFPSVTSG